MINAAWPAAGRPGGDVAAPRCRAHAGDGRTRRRMRSGQRGRAVQRRGRRRTGACPALWRDACRLLADAGQASQAPAALRDPLQ